MRPELDKEIDSLLRGHARRGGAFVPENNPAPPQAAGAHLDADELAAFAEGALPDVARTLYSAHLADCGDCRGLVAQLSLAAGIADRVEERERRIAPAVSAAPSWRERVAALFAPRAWRYAMPVVALLAVSTVVLVVTRQLPREDSARTTREERNSAPPSAPAAPDLHHAEASPDQLARPGEGGNANAAAAPTVGEEGQSAATRAANTSEPKQQTQDAPGRAASGSAGGSAPAPTSAQPVAESRPAPPATFATGVAATPTPPPPPAAAPRAMSKPEPSVVTATASPAERAEAESRERSREESSAMKRHGPQRAADRRGSAGGDAAASRSARDAAPPSSAGSSRNETRGESASVTAGREQSAAETRSVGGRRFRRQNGVWIDTAYKTSQATVVVRRDSEQYRALVADEPEVGRISRALGGEAVIVWKGRAYRVKP